MSYPFIQNVQALRTRQEKIAMLTCYDATFAKLSALAGVDVLLVGDSLGMVIQGADNTLSVSMADMIYHTRVVANGAPNAAIMSDMPANSYEHDANVALKNAKALIEAGAHIVKIEGAGEIVKIAAHLVKNGVPVCAHLGFTPQSVAQLGGYKVQGKTQDSAAQILDDALAMTNVGVSIILLEMVPANLAKTITESVTVPTIGIGAGVDCSGQVLVLQDLLGIYTGASHKAPETFKSPRFVRNFLKDNDSIEGAIKAYVKAVKAKTFPAIEHCY
jgi:3-methyl-2-oxobutanoate hydroxymethyltransferase